LLSTATVRLLLDLAGRLVLNPCDCFGRWEEALMGDLAIVVTGGCGFIGSNFIRLLLSEAASLDVLNLDLLTYAGNPANLADLNGDPRLSFHRCDVADRSAVEQALSEWGRTPTHIVNFAAETHVDRSVLDPEGFLRTNVAGTCTLLEVCRTIAGVRFVQVGTDEVYGSLGSEGRFTEASSLAPNSPYSASKASADLLVRAWHRTYGVDTVITRSSNNYGPFQFPEKLVPFMILNASTGRELPVYGTGGNVRDWLHVSDHCAGILAALRKGRSGGLYNLGGGFERTNLDVVHLIADRVCGHRGLVRFVEDRPGHDWRYAIDSSRALQELGWEACVPFEAGLSRTIDWYLANEGWWRPVISGEHSRFGRRWYGEHL